MAAGKITDDPLRLSESEALMWSLEEDPHLSSTFANLTLLDTEPDVEVLRRRLWQATQTVPRLRQRIAEGPLPFTSPAWEEAPNVDLGRHLRTVALPAGATEADARAFAVAAAAAPFDRAHPLWEFTVLTGLPDGRAAMVQKLHHTITDGQGGIRMSLAFIDLERQPAEPPVDEALDLPPEPPTPPPAWAALATRLSEAARRNTETARRLSESAWDLVRDPAQLASLVAGLPADTAATVRSLVRQAGVLEPRRSPLWTQRSLDRNLQTFDISLDAVRATAAATGVTVNDVFVAAAAGGAGRYHRRAGAEVDELRMSMPVSRRTDQAPAGNAFTPTRVLVPIAADPRQRLAEVHARLAVTKSERALHLLEPLAGLANLLPRPVLLRLARQQVTTVDFTTSNVRAAPFDLYIGGARIEGNYPLGPIVGTSWNLTTMTYRGNLNLGLHVDRGAVADPSALRDDILDAFEELLALG